MSAYILYQGGAPTAAKEIAQEQKKFQALLVADQQQPGPTSVVIRDSISIDNNGILSFKVQTTGVPERSFLGATLFTGRLDMTLSGTDGQNFNWTQWGSSLGGTVGSNGVTEFSASVVGISGPAYLKIVPDYSYGAQPAITSFGANGGPYIPCNPCPSRLNYTK